MKILHSGDWHFQNDPTALEEVVRVTDYLAMVAKKEQPDVIVLAGDTVDEIHSRIRLDSEAARAVIKAVTAMGDIAPVVIVRGTLSHDRNSPYIFESLRTRFPVVVASEPMQVMLTSWEGNAGHKEYGFSLLGQPQYIGKFEAVFTLLPSLDKSWMAANFGGGIREGNASWRESLHDLLAGFGLINEGFDCPRILVTHGMLTGAQFSSGQEAIGEDMEFGVDTLRAAKADFVALGHVHRMQTFGSDIAYCGSPGRMNFGEPEEKGALLVEVERGTAPVMRFIPTPARRFVFAEAAFEDVPAELARVVADCRDAHVRFRYSIPEEQRHAVSREALEAAILESGAAKVKIECQIIPIVRSRAAGISAVPSLVAKLQKWGEVTATVIPPRVLEIAGAIEGLTVEELQRRFK